MKFAWPLKLGTQISVRIILAAAVVLAATMFLCRGAILFAQIANLHSLAAASLVFRATMADWAVCWIAAFAFIFAAKRTQRHDVVAYSFVGLALILAGAAIANVNAVRMLGGPITVQWLAFADIANSSYMIEVLLAAMKPAWLFGFLAAVFVFLGVTAGIARFLPFHWFRSVGSLLIPLILVAVSSSGTDLGGKAANPLIAFLGSAVSPSPISADLLASERTSASEWQPAEKFTEVLPAVPRPDTSSTKIHNVIIYVMESTASRFVHGYGPEHEITPVIASLASTGLKVTDAYAHAPASSYSLVALLAGIVPELSPYGMADNRPDLKFDGMPALFAAQGYRTGFFASPDNRFQGTGDFASRAGFETVKDSRDWPCSLGRYSYEGSTENFLDTSNDNCLVPPVLDFIDSEPGRPFFTMLWTGMAHYPYFPGPNPQKYVEDDDENKYLNAVRESDAALGQLVQGLKERNLLDDTLIVILGDHGEAFGEHGQYSHASEIYEENIRIPLYFVNPRLFSGQTADRIVGMSDVAPTIADLLNLNVPDSWQGKSIFSENHPNGVMFFTAWNGMQIGYREGSTKFVLNANTGSRRLYDLAADPDERNDLSKSQPEKLAAARDKLASWVRLQEHRTEVILGSSTESHETAGGPSTISIRASGTEFAGPPKATLRLDGVDIGEISVTSAISNADHQVEWATALEHVADYSLSADIGSCPRTVEIKFLNDDWAGDGKTGDTNLFIKSVTVGDKVYYPWQFKLATEGAGTEDDDVFYFWRAGTVLVPLEPSAECIVGDLSSPNNME